MLTMTNNRKVSVVGIVLSALLPVQIAFGSSLTIPNSWITDDTLFATDLNKNFDDTATAVNSKQDRVTGTCSSNAIASINANGTVVCAATLTNGIKTVTMSPISNLPNTDTDLLNFAVNIPAAGYVHVVLTGIIDIQGKTNNTSADFSRVYVGVTDTSGTSPLNGNFTVFYRSGTDATGAYDIPYTVQAVFTVPSGTRTFYLVARNDGGSGTATLYYNRMTITYHGSNL